VKIRQITPYLVDRCLLVQIETDEGIVGVGEAGLWAHHRLVSEMITDLSDYFVGKDAGLMDFHQQSVIRSTHFSGPILSAALSAFDIALWDILGKSLGKPVYELLGGRCRSHVRVFGNVVGDTVEERAQVARDLVAQGYQSLRTQPFFRGWETQNSTATIGMVVDIVGAIRDAIGYEIDFGVEIHRNLTPAEAIIAARELEPFRLLYYEDPTAPESLEALEYIARHVDIPIAAGERSHNIFQFKELIDSGTVSLIRPDLSLAGGFTQCKKIAGIAEASFIDLFPHLMGSPVNRAAFVHLNASIPNYALMESGNVELNEIVDYPPEVRDGHIEVSDRPGIGVELQVENLEKFPHRTQRIAAAHRWDGAVAH
jgi:galactonate dehydratase